ncbi:MAG: GyrI-like domain-containing protein [Pseudomonadota bacterium]
MRLVVAALFMALACFPVCADDKLVVAAEVLGRTPSDLPIERVRMKAMPVAVQKVEGQLADAPKDLPKAINALKAKLGAKNIEIADVPLVEFKTATEKTYTASILLPLVERPKEPDQGIELDQFYGGKALRITHKGPLEKLEDTYFELQTFVEDGDFEIQDTTVERYLTDPSTTAPDDMVTEVYLLLKDQK